MTSRRILTENIASLTVVQVLNWMAPLITVPYLVRVLGPAHFGLLSFAQSVVLYFDFATDYSFNFTATRAISAQRGNQRAVSAIFWSTISAKALLMCTNIVLLALLVAIVPAIRAEAPLFSVSLLYLIGTTAFPLWLFQGLEKLKVAAALVGLARLLTIPALFFFVHKQSDYVIAGALQASVELIAAVFAIPQLLRLSNIEWCRPTWSCIRAALRDGWPLFLCGLSQFALTSNTTLILGFVTTPAEVGYFSASDKLIKAAIAALSPVGQALYPHLTELKDRSIDSVFALLRRSLAAMGALSLLISVATFVFAKPVCNLLLGHKFAPSVSVLEWLSPLPLLAALANVLGTQTMLVFEMDSLFTRILLRNVLCGFPVLLMAARFFGSRGAAAASSALGCALVLQMAYALRQTGANIFTVPRSTEREVHT